MQVKHPIALKAGRRTISIPALLVSELNVGNCRALRAMSTSSFPHPKASLCAETGCNVSPSTRLLRAPD